MFLYTIHLPLSRGRCQAHQADASAPRAAPLLLLLFIIIVAQTIIFQHDPIGFRQNPQFSTETALRAIHQRRTVDENHGSLLQSSAF